MTVRTIQKVVAKHYGITVERMMSKNRGFVIVRARHVAMYFARVLVGASFPELGRAFDRDHTSVLDGYRRIEELVNNDAGVKADIDSLRRQLEAQSAAVDTPVGVCPGCKRPYEAMSLDSVRDEMKRLQRRLDDIAFNGAA